MSEERENAASKLCEADPLTWGQLIFGAHFRERSPDFHFVMLDAAMSFRRLAVAAPRESAKSTLLVFLYPFHCITFRKKHFILIVSNTFKKAAMHLESIKTELRDNKIIKECFPLIEITKDAEGDSEFKHPDGFRIKVLCKGVDQIGSVRGVKFGAYRPDLIIGDDIEDDELVRNIERRIELRANFDEALIPAGDKSNCQYIFVGTVLHDDSQISHLVSSDEYTDYKKLFFKALDEKNEISLWPEKWSVADLKKLRELRPTVFAKEYQNDPAQGGNAIFIKDYFRYWQQDGDNYVLRNKEGGISGKGSLSDCKAAIACDLAWQEKRQNDFSAILCGYLTPNSDLLFDRYICKRGMRPEEIEEHLFLMEEQLRKSTGSTVPIGFEKAMLENVTRWLLRQAMIRRNHFLLTKDLLWDADKIKRAETRLSPRYAQGMIYHRQDMGELEHQIVRFPTGAHDDLVDCAQGLVQLLQYPRRVQKETKQEDEFMWWRQQAINQYKPEERRIGRFTKRKGFTIPARKSWR